MHFKDIDARYFVHGRMEILALLHDFIYRHESLQLDFGTGETLAIHLLEARDQVLIFEADVDAATKQRLAAAASCHFLACPDGIQVQFASDAPQQVSWDGKEAFSVPLPLRLARLQRQESFRAAVPRSSAPQVALHDANDNLLGLWPLRDLSTGGLSVALKTQADLALAPRIARVRVTIADQGLIDCEVHLRHATALTLHAADLVFRVGLGFVGLPDAMRVAIQRYIIDLEHARRNARRSPSAEG